jgi:hypothetical protein
LKRREYRADETDFKAKKLKINLNMPVKTEQKAESVEVLAAVEEDRKFIYQAVIVRIMKSRKVSFFSFLSFSLFRSSVPSLSITPAVFLSAWRFPE